MSAALGQGPEELDQEGHIAALMDVADRAFQDATQADAGALRAASRSSTRAEERLEAVMHATHDQWREAERHYGLAHEAHAEGQRSRLEYHASEVVRAAVETQRAAGVATTAEALKNIVEGLKPATEQARLADTREQLSAKLAQLEAQDDRQLTAVTRMDTANRDRLRSDQWHAKGTVPELGWWPALAADMTHALEGRLWLDETGAARLLREPAGDRVVPGRKVNAERVAMLRAAGFLVTDTRTDTSTLLRSSTMGREALYLATLYPEGLHEDERRAYEARYEQSRRPWMNNEERKSAARRLPPLDRYVMRAVREKPVLLDGDQVPQISPEDAARHADEAQLAQNFARWVAMSRGERPDAVHGLRMAQAQSLEAVARTVGQDAATGEVQSAEQPLSEMLPPTSGDNGLPAGPSEGTTTPDEEHEDAMGSRAADETSTRPLPAENGDEYPQTEGWSGDAPSALAATPSAAAWADDRVPAALAESPRSQEDSTRDSTAQPSPADESGDSAPAAESAGSSTADASRSEPDFETRRRERLASNVAYGAVLGIDPSAGESYEGYAGRFDGDYDITLPSGRYCYRAPGFDRKNYSVRYIPNPASTTNSQRIGAVSHPSEIMPMIRRHAARHADKRDPLVVELDEHERNALDDVARGVISRSRGEWYRHNGQGIATQQTYEWTTRALWTLSALGLIQVPTTDPYRPGTRFARLSELGERRHSALRGEPEAERQQPGVQERTVVAEPAFGQTPQLGDQDAGAVTTAPTVPTSEAPLAQSASGQKTVGARTSTAPLPATAAGARPSIMPPHESTATEAPVGRDADNTLADGQAESVPDSTEGPAVDLTPSTADTTAPNSGATSRTVANHVPRPQPADREEPSHDQGELFAVPEPIAATTGAEPEAQSAATVPADPAEGEPPFPKLTQAASRALFDIARGDITEVDGIFMKRTSTRGTIAKAPSQKAVNTLLDQGLAERAGQHISLSERGTRWFSHHNIKLPSTGLRDTSALDASVLPPIDYTPLHHLPVADEQPDRMRPPAPNPPPADWPTRSRAQSAAETQAIKEKATAARARAAQSTTRALVDLAAGTEKNSQWVWRNQYPLAQYDENAAAALERLTDPAAHAYATRSVHQLRTAIEAVGRVATADYVQRILGAGTDPVAMDKVWRTTAGIQADDTYRHRIRGTVITYLNAIGKHAEEVGLDWQAIVDTLEDAAGWKGGMQPLTLRHQYEHAYFPDAEQTADAAAFVAKALHDYALGESDAVDAWAHLRDTWRTIEPRPAPVAVATTTGDATVAADAPPIQNVPATPDGPASSLTTTIGLTTAAPEATPDAITQGGFAGVPTHLSETTPAPADQDEEPGTPDTEQGVPVPDVTATAEPGDRPVPATPGPNGPPRPPAAQREESTVATNAPPSAASPKEPSSPGQPASGAVPFAWQTAAPYSNAVAYTAAHKALMTELDQHEQWLAHTPAAAAAAASLDSTRTLGIPGLTALLALQSALPPAAGSGSRLTGLANLLGHHVRCAQLSLAKAYFGQAGRASNKKALRRLYEGAREGRFLDLTHQTQAGEMELGHYLDHRSQQVPEQPAVAEYPAEVTREAAEEATVTAVDHDDDSEMPVFQRPGEVYLSAGEAAPHLHAHAQTILANGTRGIELLAHIHGRPVYVMVAEGPESDPSLYLGLALRGEANERTVHIGADQLAQVTPDELLAAVTEWMSTSDDGDRPLLDHGSSAAPRTAPGPAAVQGQVGPVEAQQPAPAAAPDEQAAMNTDSTTAPQDAGAEANEPQVAQDPAEPPASAPASAAKAAAPATESNVPDLAATPPAQEAQAPTVSGEATSEEQAAPSAATAAAAPQADSATAVEEPRAQADTQQGKSTPAAPAKVPTPDTAAAVEQLTALVRSALTDLGITLEATGVLTAERAVVITLETSGTAEQDRKITDNLRPALHKAIREHPDHGLAAYRVDFQHTPQVGQGALQDAPGPAAKSVARERLIAANEAAAKLFIDRLQNDPNAQLARTYLTEERQLPPDVQEEWGLGYAPSDGHAGRWDVAVCALRDQGFTDEELLQAGLAKRSPRGTLYDPFRDRIMFAIHDEHGDIVGFSGRRIDRPGESEAQAKKRGGPKYYNTSNGALFSKGDLVFGLHHPAQAQALANSNGPRVSVEGYLDVIAVARAAATVPLDQRPVAGAPMGTAFTERQLTALRGLDTDNPRSHIAFLDADANGHKVLLDKWDLFVQAPGETTVTSASDAKDAAQLWEEGIKADGDGATPVLRVLEQHQPLLNAAVEAVLMKNADEAERTDHAFDAAKFFQRTQAIAAEAARYIHQTVQTQAPGNTAALEQAALDWAKRLEQEWSIPGHMTATAVLLGPGKHHEDYENEVYEQALDLLAADPEGYFANDPRVRSRQSAAEPAPATAPATPDGTGPTAARPGQWPAGTRASGPVTSTNTAADKQAPAHGELKLRMVLPSPVDGQPVEYTDRTTAAYALQIAVHERLGQHTAESPEPGRLPQPLKLGTVYGVDLSTSGDDQTSDDPTVVVWLGTSRNDSLRMSYSRFVELTAPELLAAVEWRAAQAAGRLGAPLSQTWRDAVRSILPGQFPAQPTPARLADLLDTIAHGPDGSAERTRHRAEQALALYTAGHPDLALNVLAADDHIWVLRNDGSWIQEETDNTELSWKELDNGFSQEATELNDIAEAAAALPPGDTVPMPMPADLTVAHHSAHEALAALRPYSIGLPNTCYEKITDVVAQMDAGEPVLRRLHGPDGEQLMNRAKMSFVRVLEGLATVASKIKLTGLSTRLERTIARLRGQDPASLPASRAVRMDRRMQDLAHIERDLERRMATPITLDERGELQEQWITNHARWRARYEQLHGQPPHTDFLPDNGLVAGAPPIPNQTAAHRILVNRLRERVKELRDTDPHTKEDGNPYDPTADLFNGVAWAYQQRLIGTVPTDDDPQRLIPASQLRRAALIVTSHQEASPLTLRRAMSVTAERADRLLHRLEEQQILGPYRADAPRTVLARPSDISALLARPATPPALRKPAPAPAAAGAEPGGAYSSGLDEARIREFVNKFLADKYERSETHAEPEAADRTVRAPRVRKNAHKEAETNGLTASHPTSLAPTQS
ncbi:hypothetical protein ACFYY1_30130 [Streptomyces sp. NPDC001890]|uniref:hypothetical protein n=1 Tax=Streptomyces sp. NPDC001890 TaxID=3364620 RepID=UPI0036D005AC